MQTDLTFYSEDDIGRLKYEIECHRTVELDLRMQLDEAYHNHNDMLEKLCNVRQANIKMERGNDDLLRMVARAERESVILTNAIEATRTTSELLVRVREMQAFTILIHCGHSVCLQCGLSHWLRHIMTGTMHVEMLDLKAVLCPICRAPFPPLLRDPITNEHVMSYMPFCCNVQTDELTSQLFEDLSVAMRELHAALPHDPVVTEWTGKYGRDGGAEWTRYHTKSGQYANTWTFFTTLVWPAESLYGIRTVGHVLDDEFHIYSPDV
ncbi:hypothetical protein JVT61DRAFT_11075 [Boletus reticuloceps]|uniref:Uncharacterized protein n=1 Tax=Boletus reticuloceps TaxID=495285 RepID=A0A8I2YFI8_9AGAM|nr:hypothetical protein JVT61DRAFT_11075 [Boletus reticuloceps]